MSYDFDLGPWSRNVSTISAAAQIWFDRGFNWNYAYNHEEAVAWYRQAAKEASSSERVNSTFTAAALRPLHALSGRNARISVDSRQAATNLRLRTTYLGNVG
jgi:hypothetical protein